jgi:TPR repeat protein
VAQSWYLKAAAKGSAIAAYNAASFHYHSRHRPIPFEPSDYDEAIRLYTLAVDGGHWEAGDQLYLLVSDY